MPYLLEILGKTRGLDHEWELLGNGETLVDLKRLWLGGKSFHINNDGGPNKIKVKISLFYSQNEYLLQVSNSVQDLCSSW